MGIDVLTLARLPVGDRLRRIPVVALLAVVAVPAVGEMPALEADSSAHPPGELVQLHVESAFLRVLVAVAGWKRKELD